MRYSIPLILLITLVACQKQSENLNISQNYSMVILVRHAEKVSDEPDSPLTEDGNRRAQDLLSVLEFSKIDHIISSQFKRNIDTIKPFADSNGIAITVFAADLNNPEIQSDLIVKDINEKHLGKSILIVGHTNTIPLIIEKLLEKKVDLKDIAYHDIFIINLTSSGKKSLVRAQYGKQKMYIQFEHRK